MHVKRSLSYTVKSRTKHRWPYPAQRYSQNAAKNDRCLKCFSLGNPQLIHAVKVNKLCQQAYESPLFMESFTLHQVGEGPRCSLWAIRSKQPTFTPSSDATPIIASRLHYTSWIRSMRGSSNSASLNWFSWGVGYTRPSCSYMTKDKHCPKIRPLSHTQFTQPTHSKRCFQPNNTPTWCHIVEQRNQHQKQCEQT